MLVVSRSILVALAALAALTTTGATTPTCSAPEINAASSSARTEWPWISQIQEGIYLATFNIDFTEEICVR